jgi:gamma-glutamylaminecyclotransferase
VNTRVFVYGTLLHGECNHALLEQAELLGRWRTPAAYRMLHLGTYPGVVERGSGGIDGEVYGISTRQLVALDRLEDHPRLYRRKPLSTPWGRAWIYLFCGARDGRAVISSGNWRLHGRPDRRRITCD